MYIILYNNIMDIICFINCLHEWSIYSVFCHCTVFWFHKGKQNRHSFCLHGIWEMNNEQVNKSIYTHAVQIVHAIIRKNRFLRKRMTPLYLGAGKILFPCFSTSN